jgi:hypothetical protein
MRIIRTAANWSPTVTSRRAKYDGAFLVLSLKVHSQRATHNINMASGPKKGGKLAHGRIQSALPVCAKTRRQTTTPDGTSGLLCLRSALVGIKRQLWRDQVK